MTVTATMHDLQIDDWALGRPIDDEWVELLETQNHVAAAYRQVPISTLALAEDPDLPIMTWTAVWQQFVHIPEDVAQVRLTVYADSTGAGTTTFRITDGTNTATTAAITVLAQESATLTLAATGDVTLKIEAESSAGAQVAGVVVEFLPIVASALP